MTHFGVIVSILAAIFTALAILASGVRWIYRQGVSSQNMVNALNDNTRANARVSNAFEVFSARIDGTLVQLEKRVTVLEVRERRKGW